MRIIVIGGGIMGLSAAWQLTRRGERPIVLERFARAHSRGASHGETRNFNNAYADDHYLDLLLRAREGWDALGEVDGEPLLRLHGLVSHGAGAALGSATGEGLIAVERRLRERGIPAELLDGAEAARRWPGMRFEGTVLHSPDAGVARAAAALRELERRIAAAGGEVHWETPVLGVADEGESVSVRTAAGILIADAVIVTVGAWTRPLVEPLGIALPPLRVTEESPAHFAPRDPATPWPSFNHFVSPGSWPANVYGMPTPGEGVKVGFHCVGDEVDPDARRFAPVREVELAAYVSEWFPASIPRRRCRSAARTPRRPTRRSSSTGSAASSWGRGSPGRGSSSRRASARHSPTSRSTPRRPSPRRSASADPVQRARTTRVSSHTGSSDS